MGHRHVHSPPEVRAENERKFKELGTALEILGDEQRRKLWDIGYDKTAIEERIAASDRAAHNHGAHNHGHGHHH